jgi:hypothetical protein
MKYMARTAMTKHVVRRQEETFVDWFAELRELAGERWPEISEQALERRAERRTIGRPYVWLRRFNGRLL